MRPSRPSRLPGLVVLSALVLLLPDFAAARQDATPPNRGGFTTSMGKPSALRWSAGIAIGADRWDGGETTGHLTAGFYRDLVNPAIAALGVEGQLYGGRRGNFDRFSEGWDGGARLGIASPVARFAIGADWNAVDEDVALYLSLVHPLRRSGILVGGGLFRATWLPGRNHSTSFGLTLPVGQRFAGRTRPVSDRVRIPVARRGPAIGFVPSPAVTEALAEAAEHARWILHLTVPFVDAWHANPDRSIERFATDIEQLREHLDGTGMSAPEHATAFHDAMARAFSLVLAEPGDSDGGPNAYGGSEGAREPAGSIGDDTPDGWPAWDIAREILLDDVLLPYNRLLGQKRANDSVLGFGGMASMRFYERLASDDRLPRDRLVAAAWLFARAIETIEGVREESRSLWRDGRFVFLPLQLAVLPDEVSGQAALDAMLERALGTTFTPGNEVFYIENEQFQAEFSRMVHEARDYSVLWIHDYRGVDGDGNPDPVAHFHAVDTYLRALTDAVRRYDEEGKIPRHIILLDQWFYQANRGWLFLDLLHDPLHHVLRLPSAYAEMEASVRDAQAELRTAVAESRLLQAQATHAAPGWIRNLVRVHVNITNPADATFWTREILPLIGLPDMVARDHRKVAFFDLSEEDPHRGRAMYTGMGIGAHYAGAGWEDRALMVRGPGVLNLKTEARELLLRQGFAEEEIPWELRPRPFAPDYRERIDAFVRGNPESARALEVHNQVGFGDKDVNLLKAVLYTLLPPGAVVKAPDSLWNHPLWGSMLLGHALRGGRVLVIAPDIAHAPSDGFPQMSRARDLMGRLVLAGILLEGPLERSGGYLKVGLYGPDSDVGNTPARMRAVASTIETTPWLGELMGMRPEALERLRDEAARLDAEGFDRTYLVGAAAAIPRLHLKAHFIATREAWDGLLGRGAAEDLLSAFFGTIADQNLRLAEGSAAPMEALTRAMIPPGRSLAEAQFAALREEARTEVALYYLVGSHNQNYRSFTTDGEVIFTVAGWPALHGLPDFVVLAGLSTWIETLEELEALFPSYEGIRRRIGRFIRLLV